MTVERVAIIGDTHSDGSFVANALKLVKSHSQPVTKIIQLGDFGYTFDRNMIASITAWLERDPEHKWYWLDGNHDEHNILRTLTDGYGHTDPIDMGDLSVGSTKLPERLYYCPRSSVLTIGETKCMFMGGAYSIDKEYRRENVSWWPQELITEADILRAEERGKVDVVFSHDMPIVPEFEVMLNTNGYKVGPESLQNRMAMNAVVAATRPQHLYHGHYHHRHNGVHTTKDGWEVEVHGVGANVSPRGYIDHNAYYEQNVLFRDL